MHGSRSLRVNRNVLWSGRNAPPTHGVIAKMFHVEHWAMPPRRASISPIRIMVCASVPRDLHLRLHDLAHLVDCHCRGRI